MVVPETVERELRRQSHEIPVLNEVLNADWIQIDRSDDIEFLTKFSRYEGRLVVGDANLGECGVLALGASRGCELVLDDGVARTLAEEDHLRVTSTLSLLCRAIREGQLTVPMVEKLADDLLMGDYYLPFSRGGFRAWALQEGLIDYE